MNLNEILTHINNKPHTDERLEIIYTILKVYNCRISEILSATYQNYFPHKYLVLKGNKKSADIIVRDREILRNINKLTKQNNTYIFNNIKYKNVYNYLLNNNLININAIKIKKNLKVTHYFRYINLETSNDKETNKVLLHHNSKTSQDYYTNKKN